MSRTAWSRRDYAARKERGDCVRAGCPDKAENRGVYCPAHGEERRAYYRAYWKTSAKRRKKVRADKNARQRKRRRAGLCIRCGRAARMQHCARCVKAARAFEGRSEVRPHSYCAACGKRGHRWEDCPEESASTEAHATDYMRTGTSNLGAA